MGLIDRISAMFKQRSTAAEPTTSDEIKPPVRIAALPNLFQAERDRAAVVRQCREMYATDMRVKRLIGTLARDATRGEFTIVSDQAQAVDVATAMLQRVKLSDRLDDYMRMTLRDGDTLLEISVNAQAEIVSMSHKPTLEIRRNSDAFDRFADPAKAFWWSDTLWLGLEAPENAVWFAEWQIIHARWAHDEGSRYGAPLFAAATSAFKRMSQGEMDIAVRRKTRAGQKYLHVVEGATEDELVEYQERNQAALDNPYAPTADFFTNQAGSISVIGGDATLDQIEDVMHHIRSFWTASPVPMSLIGYGQDLNRDVLDKQKEEYDEELEIVTKWIDDEIVRPLVDRQLLLAGILPETAAYTIGRKKKAVLTAVMIRDAADAALRLRALGLPDAAIGQVLAPFLPGIDLQAAFAQAGNDVERLADAAAGV
jgi:hypothetical protein